MEIKTYKKNLKNLISENKFDSFFKEIDKTIKGDSAILNSFIVLKSAYNKINSERNSNIITYIDYSIESSRITNSLLNMVNDILTEDLSINISTNKAIDNKIAAKDYFIHYLNPNEWKDWFLESLPNLSECKQIFKGDNAYIYFGHIQELKEQFQKEDLINADQRFLTCDIHLIGVQDIIDNGNNVPGGMKANIAKFQYEIVFYEVIYFKEITDQSGYMLRYFINIDDKWIFLPKPWRVFRALNHINNQDSY